MEKFLPSFVFIVRVEGTCFDVLFALAYNFIDIFATKMSFPAMKTTYSEELKYMTKKNR